MGITTIMVTHDAAEALSMADRELLCATLSHEPFEVGEEVAVTFSLERAAVLTDGCEKGSIL